VTAGLSIRSLRLQHARKFTKYRLKVDDMLQDRMRHHEIERVVLVRNPKIFIDPCAGRLCGPAFRVSSDPKILYITRISQFQIAMHVVPVRIKAIVPPSVDLSSRPPAEIEHLAGMIDEEAADRVMRINLGTR
jgi:hypothetical protein